ncbi:MAG: metallophosphoesterase family protein [Candidatus Helarchaeota archaeon]
MTVNIAILGDLHGHLTLAFLILKRWQKENNENIDFILQVGDLGAFPDVQRIDKATKRFLEKDPDELGFLNYYHKSPEADLIFNAKNNINVPFLYFIKGNHEDFEFLERISKNKDVPVPIDHYKKIYFLKSGKIYKIKVKKHSFTIGVLGGISSSSPDINAPKYYSKEEIEQLLQAKSPINILLTHDAPFNFLSDQRGSKDIIELINYLKPQFHFCGHYHIEGRCISLSPDTQSFILNEVNFNEKGLLKKNSIGILHIEGNDKFSFQFINDEWLSEYTRYNYKSFL